MSRNLERDTASDTASMLVFNWRRLSFRFDHIQCCFCNLHSQMSCTTPTSQLAGRVFAIRRLQPTIDKEESSHLEPTNSLARHDHSDVHAPSRPLPISMVGQTSTHADLTTTCLNTPPSLLDSITSSNDLTSKGKNNQKYVPACSH